MDDFMVTDGRIKREREWEKEKRGSHKFDWNKNEN